MLPTKSRALILAVSLVGFAFASNAWAEPISVQCEAEDTINSSWNGPLAIIYAGGESGQLDVKSQHVTFSISASQSERTGVVDGVEKKATGIRGSGEIESLMPDVQALLDCASTTIQPDFKDDPDMQAMAITQCVPKVAMGSAPVKVFASASVGLVASADPKQPDVIVEIKRSYTGVTAPSGKDISIETYPKNCKLAGP